MLPLESCIFLDTQILEYSHSKDVDQRCSFRVFSERLSYMIGQVDSMLVLAVWPARLSNRGGVRGCSQTGLAVLRWRRHFEWAKDR